MTSREVERIAAARAHEQSRAADLRGPARERDPERIVGPQAKPPTRKRHMCRGCLRLPEYTKGYCLSCYAKVRLGRSLEFDELYGGDADAEDTKL